MRSSAAYEGVFEILRAELGDRLRISDAQSGVGFAPGAWPLHAPLGVAAAAAAEASGSPGTCRRDGAPYFELCARQRMQEVLVRLGLVSSESQALQLTRSVDQIR